MERLRIIVTGFIGLYPTGGVTWDYIQYPLGLKLLGHDVYYIEDTGQYTTYRITDRAWNDPHDSVEYLKNTMEEFGLAGRWAYRDAFSNTCFGLSLETVLKICSTADVFINVSASSILREEYLKIPKRVLIDSDPMFTQVQTFEDKQFIYEGLEKKKVGILDYNYHFTFGENIGADDCHIPDLNLNWTTTRQPVCLNLWQADEVKNVRKGPKKFTTIMNWSTRSKLNYNNTEWGQKDVEFVRFLAIPKLFTEAEFDIVLSVSADFKKELNPEIIKQQGWKISDPSQTISTAKEYTSFIAASDGEFSVAKETYVKSVSGWFSCRSACYLAAGRPVITQETGWSKYIPVGSGLFSFSDEQSAIYALTEVTNNLEKHSAFAREIANEYFDSGKVLTNLLNNL